MSRLFGEIRQMGYVVRDIEDAMHHWIEVCGVGPWFYIDKLPMFDFYYRGQAGDPHLSIALANSGDVQVFQQVRWPDLLGHVNKGVYRAARRPGFLRYFEIS